MPEPHVTKHAAYTAADRDAYWRTAEIRAAVDRLRPAPAHHLTRWWLAAPGAAAVLSALVVLR